MKLNAIALKGPAPIELQPKSEEWIEDTGRGEPEHERCLSISCCNMSGSIGLGCLCAFTTSLAILRF